VDNVFTDAHTYWKGFPNRSAKGLHFEWLQATTRSSRCDYSAANLNDGWGWNGVSEQSCEPIVVEDNCDYSQANTGGNNGYGWDPITEQSCPPR
jgi:hypothetical protein